MRNPTARTSTITAISGVAIFATFFLAFVAKADERCGPGKIFDRGVIGCIQEKCPPTTGRNYGGVCQCYNPDWGGNQKKRTDCYDKDGLLSHCAPEGMACDKVEKPVIDAQTGLYTDVSVLHAEEDAGIINPAHHVVIETRVPACESKDGGAITVRTVSAPEGFNIDTSVVASQNGGYVIAGQDAEADYGDKIKVPPGHEVTVTIGGVAIVHLAENSIFTIPCSADRARLEGRGFFEILHDIMTGNNHFEVEGANAIAGSRGTTYLVDAHVATETQVLLVQGSVEVTKIATGEKRVLQPGEKGVVSDSNALIEVTPISAQEMKSLEHFQSSDTRIKFIPYALIIAVLLFALAIGGLYLRRAQRRS